MRILNADELKNILLNHKKWLNNEPGGMRANLSGADLSHANLSRANLHGTNLSYANLSYANLSYANLRYANLHGANLSYANLSYANLSYANLSGANLSRANLHGANLSDANLSYANLSGANLSNADLEIGKIIHLFTIVPEAGPFYGYKKLKSGAVATLYIPRSAKRHGGLVGRKCRASKVKVISIGNGKRTEDYDKHTGKLKYTVGKWITPDSFDDDPKNECTNGIHFFMTKKEAEEY